MTIDLDRGSGQTEARPEARGMSQTVLQTQRQAQGLSLTTAMRMSLTLLQLGPLDLTEAAAAEARRNPFLRWRPGPPGASGAGPAPEVAHEPTVTDALQRQIGLIPFDPEDMALARKLPHCLDARGFLADPPDEICAYLDTTPDRLGAVVARLQAAVEPVGVFAWSLKDCFRLQLEAKNRCDPLILTLLDRLDLVARRDVPAICALCGVDAEDAEDMLADIRGLCPAPLVPRPGPGTVRPAPELICMPGPDGRIRAELNAQALPALLADDGLFDRIRGVEVDAAAQAYYRDCYGAAATFVAALQRRATTLLRIGQHIAGVQGRFLASGRPEHRVPLSMSGVARELRLNKSTVSRALSDCRIETAQGIVPAADLFARPLGDGHAPRTREQALRRLSALIRGEDRRAPHADADLARIMACQGFAISRRTVAKYRRLLGVPGRAARRDPGPG